MGGWGELGGIEYPVAIAIYRNCHHRDGAIATTTMTSFGHIFSFDFFINLDTLVVVITVGGLLVIDLSVEVQLLLEHPFYLRKIATIATEPS